MADDEQHAAPPQEASPDVSLPNDAPLAITLQIVSPSITDQTVRLQDLPATTTVREVKRRIRDALPARPTDEQQRLIHRGRLLARETDTLLDIFGQELIQSSDQLTIHMALRDLVSPPASSASASRGTPSSRIQVNAPNDSSQPPAAPVQPQVNGHQYHHHASAQPPTADELAQGHAPQGLLPQAPAFAWPTQIAYQQHAQHHAQHLAQHQNMVQWMDHLRQEATGAARGTVPREQQAVSHNDMHNAVPPVMGYSLADRAAGLANAVPGANPYISHYLDEALRARALEARATQAMTGAMHRSASGASLANMAANLANTNLSGVQPIQPGVTTPLVPGTPGNRTRSATPDPSARAAQPTQPSQQPQPMPEVQAPEFPRDDDHDAPRVYMLHSPNGPLGVVANAQGEYRIAAIVQAFPPVRLSMSTNAIATQQAHILPGLLGQQTAGSFPQLGQSPPGSQRYPGQVVYLSQGYLAPPGYYAAQGNHVQGGQLQAGQQRQPRQLLAYYPNGVYYPPGYYTYANTRPGAAQSYPPYGQYLGQSPPVQPQQTQIPAAGAQQPQGQIQEQPPHGVANPPGAEGLRYRGPAGQAAAPPAIPLRAGGGMAHRGNPVGWAMAWWNVMWHVLRFAGAIWWFSYSDPSWQRWALFGICSLALLVANLGWFNSMINNAFLPVRRHLEGLIGINGQDGQDGQVQGHQAQARHQTEQRAQQGAPHGAQQQQPLQEQNQQAIGGDPRPDPSTIARRLIEERRQRGAQDHGTWLRDRARFIERAVVLLIASLAPGVAERHIRQIEERERAERRAAEERAERERAAQEAAANQHAIDNDGGEQQQTEAGAGQADENGGHPAIEGEEPVAVQGAPAQQPEEQPGEPAGAHMVAV